MFRCCRFRDWLHPAGTGDILRYPGGGHHPCSRLISTQWRLSRLVTCCRYFLENYSATFWVFNPGLKSPRLVTCRRYFQEYFPAAFRVFNPGLESACPVTCWRYSQEKRPTGWNEPPSVLPRNIRPFAIYVSSLRGCCTTCCSQRSLAFPLTILACLCLDVLSLADTYVKTYLLFDKRKFLKRKTPVSRRNSAPVYSCKVQYPARDVDNKVLHVRPNPSSFSLVSRRNVGPTLCEGLVEIFTLGT